MKVILILPETSKPAAEIALTIRKAILQRLKITVSEGIGTNKLVSAVASKLTKPAAFYEVPPGGEAAFCILCPTSGFRASAPKQAFASMRQDWSRSAMSPATPLSMLELLLGNQAAIIRQFAHGIDERPLIPLQEPQKSFSHQETFRYRSDRRGICRSRLAADGGQPLYVRCARKAAAFARLP